MSAVGRYMLNAMSIGCLAIMLSATGTPNATRRRVYDPVYSPLSVVTHRSQIGYARAFVGGQDVVQIARAECRKMPFMDVRASDLLISYTYDAKGRLVDRKVWYSSEPSNPCLCVIRM